MTRITGDVLVPANDDDHRGAREDRSTTPASRRSSIRSVLTCRSKHGVCAKCYGQRPGPRAGW
ncbi:MAG: hypothetical protein MZU95_15280 [Desulfomicrobium escambiense]|nr:hypothetical protein [Desulfomicrobium escambiense]